MSDQAILIAGITSVSGALAFLWLRSDALHRQCEKDRSELWRAVYDLSRGVQPTLPSALASRQPLSESIDPQRKSPPA